MASEAKSKKRSRKGVTVSHHYALRSLQSATTTRLYNPPTATHSNNSSNASSNAQATTSASKKRMRGATAAAREPERQLCRRKRVQKGICGHINILSTRRRVTLRPCAIQQQEFKIPCLHEDSPVVIKTNPLFSRSSPSPSPPQPQALLQQQAPDEEENGRGQEAFYGQRGKIRKTKEQEMINAIIDLTNHTKRNASKTSLLQKLRGLTAKRGGKSKISERQLHKTGPGRSKTGSSRKEGKSSATTSHQQKYQTLTHT